MKKIIIIVIVLLAVGTYVWWHKNGNVATAVADNPSSTNTNTNPVTNTQTSTPPPPITSTPSLGKYKDGTYIGSVADAFYGPVQVKVAITNGKIVDVVALQYPKDQQHSQEVSNMSLPTLRQEALSIQNSQVQTVSGATQTSEAYRKSLSSALSQAK